MPLLTETNNHKRILSFSTKNFFQKKFFLLSHPIKYACFKLAKFLNIEKQKKITLWNGKKILVNLNDQEIFTLFFFGTLPLTETNLTNFFIKNIKPHDVFYDIGANYGFYTSLAKSMIEEGEIHSFEPNPKIYNCLKQQSCNNTYINSLALGSEKKSTFLYKTNRGSGKATLIKPALRDGDIIDVHVSILDAYILDKKHPTIIKLDVEGAEIDVLEGAKKLLQTYDGIIIMEVWGGEKGIQYSMDAVNYLYKLEYDSYLIKKNGDTVMSPINPLLIKSDHDNFLFKRK